MPVVAVVATIAALFGYAPAPAPAPHVVCVVTDPRAMELSGLLATPTGYLAINDSRLDPAEIRIFNLDSRCRVRASVAYPTPARDPEDLAVAPDGAVWVADIGDNLASRSTIALWRLPPRGGAPVIYRLTYPDGSKDAEALLFTGSGEPLVITKSATTRVYTPAAPLRAGTAAGVPMRLVAALDQPFITGAAVSPDRRRVALRDYIRAYEWDVPDGGDVVAALTAAAPRLVPLPGEPQGEALAYRLDGTALLTISDLPGPAELRAYPDPPPAAPGSPSPPLALLPGEAEPFPWRMLAAATVGLALMVAGLVGLRRHRRG